MSVQNFRACRASSPNLCKPSRAPVHNPMKRVFTPVKKKMVLIVDDDRLAVHIYREKFETQGFKVEVARDANSALPTLKKDGVDLVILDLCLPGINSVELIKNIRSDSDMQSLPVIAF